jgi:pyruvate dehydrogenase E2 component (dihydrolipoamide acetyltransferase)
MTGLQVFNGIATALRQSGRSDGVRVLALHGFAADMSVWMLAEPGLGDAAALTLMDLPGHGRSAPALPDGALDGLGRHLVEVLDSIGQQPVWLLAHSFGAAVAMHAAALDPSRVAGLILISPAGAGAPVNPGFVQALCTAPDATAMRAALGQMLARPAMITPAMAQAVLEQMQDVHRGAALRTIAALLPDLDEALAPHLPALAALPIHVIRGGADSIISPDTDLPACWPDAVAHRIDGAGHLPQLEAAGPTLSAIQTALASP